MNSDPRGVAVLAALALGLGVAGCDGPNWLERHEFSRPAMGMEFRVVLFGADSAAAVGAADAAFRRIAELDAILSDYDPGSELSRLSGSAGSGAWVEVSGDLWAVVRDAQEWARRTEGVFDITVGPITQAWRWGARRGVIPPRDRLDRALARSGFEHLSLDSARRAVRLEVAGMQLDAGGIGKGYAADEAMEVLTGLGFTRALVDAGGDLVLGDPPPGEDGWEVQVAVPGPDGTVGVEVLRLANVAVAASGDSERSVEVDGITWSHILDARTGSPVRVRRLVTVMAPSGADADVLASVFSVLSAEERDTFAETLLPTGSRVRVLEAGGAGTIWTTWEPSTGGVSDEAEGVR